MTSPAAATTDNKGRRVYRAVDPSTGETVTLPSVTDVLKALAKPALETWKLKMMATGFSLRPDLVALAASDPYHAGQQAIDAAKASAAANLGTAVHAYSVEADAGTLDLATVAPAARSFMERYAAAQQAFGWRVVHAERSVCNFTMRYAGTFDRIDTISHFEGCLVADIKSGKAVYPEVALQLAAYANAEWFLEPDGTIGGPMPADLRKDVALVIHLTETKCQLIPVDLTAATAGFFGACALRMFNDAPKPLGPALALPDVTEAERLARRAWLRERAVNIVASGGADNLAVQWPRDVLPFGKSDAQTLADLDKVERALAVVERNYALPFPAEEPADGMPLAWSAHQSKQTWLRTVGDPKAINAALDAHMAEAHALDVVEAVEMFLSAEPIAEEVAVVGFILAALRSGELIKQGRADLVLGSPTFVERMGGNRDVLTKGRLASQVFGLELPASVADVLASPALVAVVSQYDAAS